MEKSKIAKDMSVIYGVLAVIGLPFVIFGLFLFFLDDGSEGSLRGLALIPLFLNLPLTIAFVLQLIAYKYNNYRFQLILLMFTLLFAVLALYVTIEGLYETNILHLISSLIILCPALLLVYLNYKIIQDIKNVCERNKFYGTKNE